jgi:molybdate/tungstate transport system substrate-binding protein
MHRRRLLAGLGTLAGLGGCLGTGRPTDERATLLVAGSLLPFARAVPGAVVEAHGSLAAARLVEDGLREPDAVALADPALVRDLVGWTATFATNAMAVAYDPESPAATAIESDWATALAREDVAVGRTDPRTDPLGYRTLLTLDLARRAGLPVEGIIERSNVFPETQLVRTLLDGPLDAAFVYRNMAENHDTPRVDLPPELDLSEPAYADRYREATVTVDGTTRRGELIRYGAAPFTERGRAVCADLVHGTERLRRFGFTVPPGYPELPANRDLRTNPGGSA